jgi:hypothetical protein
LYLIYWGPTKRKANRKNSINLLDNKIKWLDVVTAVSLNLRQSARRCNPEDGHLQNIIKWKCGPSSCGLQRPEIASRQRIQTWPVTSSARNTFLSCWPIDIGVRVWISEAAVKTSS